MTVTLYTLSTCPYCDKAKDYFEERSVPFECTDYDLADERTRARIRDEMEAAGASAFPFARIGQETVVGYAPRRYSELLGG